METWEIIWLGGVGFCLFMALFTYVKIKFQEKKKKQEDENVLLGTKEREDLK